MSQTRKLLWEGVAIVASILLAFAIDAWWDHRQDRVEEQEVLASLQEDFVANRAEAAGVLLVHRQGAELVALAHRMNAAETAGLSQDSISKILLAMAQPRTFDAVRGTVDALVGSGRLDLLRDPELRQALTVFLNLVGDSEEDARYMGEGSLRVWDLQIAHGGPWWQSRSVLSREGCDAPIPPSSCLIDDSELAYFPQPDAATLQAFLEDAELMGQVRQLRSHVARYSAEVQRIAEQVDLVLNLIDRNLQ